MPRNFLFVALFSFLSLSLFQSCSQSNSQLSKSQTFPQLLDRPEGLRNGKEWDDVQNTYGSSCAAIRKNKHDNEAKIKLAECFMVEARVTGEHPHYYPAALSTLNDAITDIKAQKKQDIHQNDLLFRALSHKAAVQLSLHDFANGLTTATEAVQINPNNASIYGCLVDANVELGNYPEAVANCDKMVAIRPDLRSYARVSYLREIYSDQVGAIEAMEMAVQAGVPGTEQTEWARLHLGGLYEKQGDLTAAETQYVTSLQYRENYPFAYAALAKIEMQQNKNEAAWKHLDQACAIIPEVSFWIEKADFQMKEGKQEAAKITFQEVEKMFQEDIAAGHQVGLELGRFHVKYTGDMNEALKCFLAEYALRPKNIEVNKELANLYSKMGDTEKAKQYMANAAVKA